MTMLQAMERTDWQLRVTHVLRRDGGWHGAMVRAIQGIEEPPPVPCEVCDNEFCRGHFVIVADERGQDTYVDVGPACAHDIGRGLPKR